MFVVAVLVMAISAPYSSQACKETLFTTQVSQQVSLKLRSLFCEYFSQHFFYFHENMTQIQYMMMVTDYVQAYYRYIRKPQETTDTSAHTRLRADVDPSPPPTHSPPPPPIFGDSSSKQHRSICQVCG